MKKTIWLIIIVFVSISNYGTAQQDATEPKVDDTYFFSTNLVLGNYIGINMDFNYVFKNGYSVSLGTTTAAKETKNKPENYSEGFSILYLNTAADRFTNYYISAGKNFNINPKNTIRFRPSIGLGYTVLKSPTNFQPIEDPAFLRENYTYDFDTYGTLGLNIEPKLEFLITRHFGMAIAPTVQFTKERILYGGGINFMIGKLR
ncbi:MAG: hypothetical protein ACSHWW_08965 [Nonlabens sp.]|uniref:hypothetical protein n=1 Tax=Nonlabens sp. TaxID=1888209 RepID=UPI003EF5D550